MWHGAFYFNWQVNWLVFNNFNVLEHFACHYVVYLLRYSLYLSRLVGAINCSDMGGWSSATSCYKLYKSTRLINILLYNQPSRERFVNCGKSFVCMWTLKNRKYSNKNRFLKEEDEKIIHEIALHSALLIVI